MLFLTTTSDSSDETFKGDDLLGFWKKITDAIAEGVGPAAIKNYQTYFVALEDQAIKSSRKISGSIKGYSDELGKVMHEVYQETVSIGGSTKDVTDFVDQYAESTSRVPPIIKETVVEATKLSKEFGLSTKEMAQMTGEFAKLGMSQSFAIQKIKEIGTIARKNMVNVGSLTKVVQENLKKSTAYTFKDGIKGLAEMAAKAERLGVKMESAFSLFDKFMDPDKAIEFATEMQMMGGGFAQQFGDAFQNMNMDVEEIRDRLTKVGSDLGQIDEKGEFKVSREGLKALRVFAEQSGESVEELTSVIAQSAKEQQIMNDVGFKPEISEEDRQLLASMAEKKDGKWQVQIPAMNDLGEVTQQWVNASDVTSKQMQDLQDAAQYQEKTVEEINKQNLPVAEQQKNLLEQIKNQLILSTNYLSGIKTVGSIETFVQSAAGPISTAMKDAVSSLDIPGLINDTSTKLLDGYINDENGLKLDIKTAGNNLKLFIAEIRSGEFIKDRTVPGGDMFLPGSGSSPKIMSEGQVFEGIVGDQVLVGTKLDEAFKISAEQMKSARAVANALGTNLENIGDPLSNMVNAKLQNTLSEKSTKLQEVVATTNSNISVSGGANVSGSVDVKVTGNGINLEDPRLSSLITAKVSEMMEQRLSKSWAEKQGNIQTY